MDVPTGARLGLRTLGAVLGTALATLGDTGGVKRATHGVIAHTRQILDAAAADQHHAMFLQVMAFTTDVADDLEAVG